MASFEGQLQATVANELQYRLDQSRLLALLTANNLDVELYASAFNPYPFAIAAARLTGLTSLQHAIHRAIKAIVGNFLSDPRISNVIRLTKREIDLVASLHNHAYRVGAFRPDFLFGNDGRTWVAEINARFPLNGFLSSALLTRCVPQLYKDAKALPQLANLEATLWARLGSQVSILKASEPGWDINLLKRWWPQQVSALTLDDLADTRSIILELHQHELWEHLTPTQLIAIARQPNLLNDLRTILIGHDKRLLSLLSTSTVLQDYLAEDDVEILKQYIIPTWVKGLAGAKVSEAMDQTRGWLAKPPRSGKGDGIVISDRLSPDAWRQALRELPDDWILQPYIDQASFPITTIENNEYVTKPMKVVGLLPTLDDQAFGPGMFRAAADDIVNVARGGTILAPTLSEVGHV